MQISIGVNQGLFLSSGFRSRLSELLIFLHFLHCCHCYHLITTLCAALILCAVQLRPLSPSVTLTGSRPCPFRTFSQDLLAHKWRRAWSILRSFASPPYFTCVCERERLSHSGACDGNARLRTQHLGLASSSSKPFTCGVRN